MKKILSLMVALMPIIAFAQVRVVTPPKQEVAKEVQATREFPYDSLTNYLKPYPQYVEKYVGQEFYMFKKEELFSNSDLSSSKIDTLINETFKVVEMINSGVYSYKGKAMYSLWLKLEQKSTSKLFYYHYTQYKELFPFLVLGYKEKIEKLVKNKKFVSSSGYGTDINTGKSVDFNTGTIWTFEEIIISSQSKSYEYLFKNSKGDEITIDFNKIISADEYNKCIKAYGRVMTHAALEKKIKIGMHEDLVVLAWGKPNKVHEASYGDMWVYNWDDSSTYVHFKNHKVSAWN